MSPCSGSTVNANYEPTASWVGMVSDWWPLNLRHLSPPTVAASMLTIQPWPICQEQIIPVQHSQYHVCWCSGSLRRQDITHEIDYAEWISSCLTWGRISTTCVRSVWRNDINFLMYLMNETPLHVNVHAFYFDMLRIISSVRSQLCLL